VNSGAGRTACGFSGRGSVARIRRRWTRPAAPPSVPAPFAASSSSSACTESAGTGSGAAPDAAAASGAASPASPGPPGDGRRHGSDGHYFLYQSCESISFNDRANPFIVKLAFFFKFLKALSSLEK